MFKVGDRVFVAVMGLQGTVVSINTEGFPGKDKWYFVNVDGYSDSLDAKMINSMAGLNHGYVPMLDEDLELV